MLEYTFTVNPEERKIIRCSVPQTFKISMYKIEREFVEVFSIAFDGERFKKVDTNRMTTILYDPVYTNKEFSFGVDSHSLTIPEKITVQLHGEFVE